MREKKYEFYSDLADEALSASGEIDFGKLVWKGKFGLEKYEFDIPDQNTARRLGKAVGHYTTINCTRLLAHLRPVSDYMAKKLAESLRAFISSNTKSDNPLIMVVGLGNGGMVADSLGVAVARGLLITESVPAELAEDLGRLCVLIPGVGGCTGIASFDIIAGTCARVKPDVIIAIDTLTASNPVRLGCSFQMSDSGIKPGAGVGNDIKMLDRQTLGVPVIALGVPMMTSGFAISENYQNRWADTIFAPKDVDLYIDKCSRTISVALNLAVHGTGYQDYC